MYALERSTAIEAVLKACRLCASVQDTLSSRDAIEKTDRSPVTVADYGAQAIVIAELRSAFPRDKIVAEEDTGNLRLRVNADVKSRVISEVRRILPLADKEIMEAIDLGTRQPDASSRFWTLDPLDGTQGFLRGEQFAVALALIEEGQVVLGVLGCPNLPLHFEKSGGARGCIFVATKNQGAFMRALEDPVEAPVHVDGVHDVTQAIFCESVESGHSSHDASARIMRTMNVQKAPRRMDSQCKYAAVSRGEASVYLRLPSEKDYEEKIWDHAAGCILVMEAGGVVTDIPGHALDFSYGRTLHANKGVIATNRGLHPQVLECARKVMTC